MHHLWAPWRIGYLTTAAKPASCVFCDCECERDHDCERGIIARGSHNFIILNAYPYNNGHLMVVPYQHESDFTKLPPHTAAEMIAMAQLAVAVLQQEYQAEGANVGINAGKAAGAGIADHVHMHVVPRWNGDTNFMTTLAETRVVPQSLADTHARLAPVMQDFVDKFLPQMLPGAE